MKVLVTQSCLTLYDPIAYQAPLSVEFSRQEYWSGLQGIFPTQGLNSGLLHCMQILYHLSHQGSPSDRFPPQQNQGLISRQGHRVHILMTQFPLQYCQMTPEAAGSRENKLCWTVGSKQLPEKIK